MDLGNDAIAFQQCIVGLFTDLREVTSNRRQLCRSAVLGDPCRSEALDFSDPFGESPCHEALDLGADQWDFDLHSRGVLHPRAVRCRRQQSRAQGGYRIPGTAKLSSPLARPPPTRLHVSFCTIPRSPRRSWRTSPGSRSRRRPNLAATITVPSASTISESRVAVPVPVPKTASLARQ
jgi:hypothetical protein